LASRKFFYPNELVGLQNVTHLIRVRELEIDPSILPECGQSTPGYDAFHDDPFCFDSRNCLELAILHTNHISEIIRLIEKRGSAHHEGGIAAFRSHFWAFYCDGAFAQMCQKFEALAAFVTDCTPQQGLCLELEFTAAARRYCGTLRAKFLNESAE
jgi:hypothetical protein